MTKAALPPLRLVIFDATDTRRRTLPARTPDGAAGVSPGLTPIWRAGAFLHGIARAADGRLAASSWGEALAWIERTSRERGRKVASIQVWGHGGWGWMQLGKTRLDSHALRPDHELAPALDAFRGCLVGPDALFWLRCCSAFGHTGRSFAQDLAARLGCKVAGHTHIIGFFQSGTHSLRPGEAPAWDPREGVRFQGGEATGALWSSADAPNTISCLSMGLPEGL
jgi:hypothetical protein